MQYLKSYLSTNSKLKRDGIYSFGIPAYKSKTGLVTCPAASKCIKGCYARNGLYNMPSVSKAQEARLALALDSELFIAVMDTEIRKRKVRVCRIHDSGDFFSAEYRDAWFAIMGYNPNVRFYAYTKNIPLFHGITLPSNFTLIYSEGGKYDSAIDRHSQRHSRVFESIEALKAAGYVDTTEHDKNAYESENHRIGLVYHGSKGKQWTTQVKETYGPKETDIPGYSD